MAQPTTGVYFSQSTPAAPPGDQIAQPQTDGASPEQSVTFIPQRATTALRGTVKPDGTTITIDGDGTIHAVAGTSSGGTGETTTSGGAYVCVIPSGAKDGSNTQYTIPSTVLEGTAYFYVTNGVMERQLGTGATFAVQGTQITRKTPLASDDWHEFRYVPGSASSETGGGGSVTPATIRGSVALTSGSGGVTSLAVPFPAGSQAGDMAVLFCVDSGGNGGSGGFRTMPSGWTLIVNGGTGGTTPLGGVNWYGYAAWRILTSGDIATGSITAATNGPGFSPNAAVAAALVTFIGASSGIREGEVNPNAALANPDVLSTSSAVLNGEIGIFFGCLALEATATIAISPGSVLQSVSTRDATGVLALATMPGGISNIAFTRVATGTTGADFVVIVKP